MRITEEEADHLARDREQWSRAVVQSNQLLEHVGEQSIADALSQSG